MSVDRDSREKNSRFESLITSIGTYSSFAAVPGLFWRITKEVISSEDQDVPKACKRIAAIFGVPPAEVQKKLETWPVLPRRTLDTRFRTSVGQVDLTRKQLKGRVWLPSDHPEHD